MTTISIELLQYNNIYPSLIVIVDTYDTPTSSCTGVSLPLPLRPQQMTGGHCFVTDGGLRCSDRRGGRHRRSKVGLTAD